MFPQSLSSSNRTPCLTRSGLALLAIIALAFLIRIAGIDWDDGRYLHPDERHIVSDVVVGRVDFSWPPQQSWLDPDESPINPRPAREEGGYEGFAYGTFPIYTVDILGNVAEELTGVDWNGYQRAQYIGRALSILFDTGTVLLVFLIATRLFGRMAGLLGAVVYAFLPVAIQASHFFTVDSWMTFFIFATICTCMRAIDRASIPQFGLVGLWFGLALASKTTAAPVAGIVLLAILFATMSESHRISSALRLGARMAARSTLALVTFIVVYFVGEPFAFLQPDALLTSFREQTDIQSGTWDVPFTQQYVGTPRFSYHLEQATRYHMGPVATLLGIAGTAALLWLVVRRRSYNAALLGIWMLGYLAVILFPETKFPRYTLPIAPALSVCAGIALTAGAIYLTQRFGRKLALAFIAAMMLVTTGYGAAFASVTLEEHTRIEASIWMHENLRPGSTATSEIWDDRVPLSIMPGLSADATRLDDASINLYSYTPTLGDVATLAPALSQLPDGDAIAAALDAGDVPQATSLLRDLSLVDFDAHAAGVSVANAPIESDLVDLVQRKRFSASQFQAELIGSAVRMTTSQGLAQHVRQLSEQIALDNTVTPAQLEELAAQIDRVADETMLREIYQLLSEADYYVLSSDRVQRGIEQNPWRYAVPSRMYELLESGNIGFAEVRQFESSPELFGVEFPDSEADETFINYDHPVVQVYEKQDLVSYETFVQLNGSAALAQTNPGRSPDNEPLTFEEPVSDRSAVANYRWSEPVTGSSWGAVLVWIVMLVGIQAAAWPLASTVFRRFPDQGWGLTRIVATIVPATLLWWLASVGFLQFRAVWVAVSFLLFALACWTWLGRRERSQRSWNFKLIAAAEAVFWITFVVFLIFKAINPDSWHLYWGGEKPMEFAQINAILRSATFPPVDPWYAQGYINYYYYSFYLVAYLVKLTGIPIEFAFNLAQPMVMGLLASGTFSVGAMLGNRLSRGRQSGIVSGLIAVALVSFAGNIAGVVQLVNNLTSESINVDPFTYWVWAPSRAIVDFEQGQMITEFPYFTGLYGDLHSHVVGMPLIVLCIALAATFAFGSNGTGTWLGRATFAKIAVTAIALGIIYPTNAWDLPVIAGLVTGGILIGTSSIASPIRRLLHIGGTAGAVAVGAAVVSLPFLWHFEALFGSIETVQATTSLLELESHVGGMLLVATAAVPGMIVLLGSKRHAAPPAVLVAVLGFVALSRWAATEQLPEAVPWLDIVTVILAAGIWLGALATIRGSAARFDFGLPRITGVALAIVGVGVVTTLLALDNLVAALYLGIGITATGVWLVKHARAMRFLALLVAGAAFIGAGVEFVFVVDDLAGSQWARMNTIFKFYNQIWILLGIAAASTAGVLIVNLYRRMSVMLRSTTSHRKRTPLEWGTIAAISTAIVLMLGSVYPVVATDERLASRFEPREGGLTLNAYAWMDYGTVTLSDGTVVSFEEDRDVIDWFNTEIEGTPVIAEAAFEPYRCNSSRISIGTGLPSVLGWQRHESQQRYPEVLPPRAEDLRTLYAAETAEEKLAIINRYDVHYIIVGDLERSYPAVTGNGCTPMQDNPQYSEYDLDEGIETFRAMEGESLEIAYQSGDTIVYRVLTTT